MNKKLIIFIFILALTCFSYKKKETGLQLFYTLNYAGDSWEKHRPGLLWTLSYLGASLPEGSFDKALTWKDSTSFYLDFTQLGFNKPALAALGTVADSLRETAYYKMHREVDLGLFITLTIGSSWHYYAITGMPKRLDECYKRKNFTRPKVFPLTRSVVAHLHRLLKYSSASDDPTNWLFVAEEGEGNLADGTFSTSIFEVFDIMSNGQLRFGIYNTNGVLIAASPKLLGEAGKPAKCLWCHEILIENLLTKTDPVAGFMSSQEFEHDIAANMETLTRFRNALKSDITFKNTQDHTRMEELYISYMQPSVKRLAQEWHMQETEVEAIVHSVEKQEHYEFGFLGELMHRRKISGMEKLVIPDDVREPSAREPDYFGNVHGSATTQ